MENHQVEYGHISLAVSILSGIIAWINTLEVAELIKNGAGVVSMLAGVMAIRYYYYATKKNKKQ